MGNRAVSVIGELASFVAGAEASALPAAERERLKLHLADTAVAALAGTRIAEGKALQGIGEAHGLADRIGRRAAAIRLTEIDDIHLPSCTTPSAGIVPVALMLAAQAQKFDDIESAVWVGTELATRIGVAVRGPQVLYRGIWPSYLAAPVAAAASAARIFGLDASRTGHALSLACMLMAGGVGRIHGAPSGRWFLYAAAVAGGVTAAQAARADYRGDADILDQDWLADTHGIVLDRGALIAGLGAESLGAESLGANSVYRSLSMKPFCSAKQAIAAVEAFRAVLGRGLQREAITKVSVHVPPAYAGMIATRAQPGARQSTMVSAAHQIALAALAPERLYDVDRRAAAEGTLDAAVAQLAAKVEIVADAALDSYYPRHWPAEVKVEAGGEVFIERVVAARGDPENPLGKVEIDDKAHGVLDPLLGSARAAEWLKLFHAALEDTAACRRLAAAFADGF